MQARIASGQRDPAAIVAKAALGRFVEPREVADAVLFLASDAATAITGVTLPVDCGWLRLLRLHRLRRRAIVQISAATEWRVSGRHRESRLPSELGECRANQRKVSFPAMLRAYPSASTTPSAGPEGAAIPLPLGGHALHEIHRRLNVDSPLRFLRSRGIVGVSANKNLVQQALRLGKAEIAESLWRGWNNSMTSVSG